ncbi:MAG: transcription termination factor NusA [Planctomycetes bacterium]|nr:transcription termination factor NusA [Planctomycetota bacterium]
MNADLIRFVDSISRDKNIEKEFVFLDLEAAMVSAARKAFDGAEDVIIVIDRTTGEIDATVNGEPIDMKTLGRIAAQIAKQVMIQRIREDERSAIFDEYSERVGTVVTGTVTRHESAGLTVNLGRGEGFLPRSEQIPGDAHHPGERIRAMILNVREDQTQVKIILTQTHKDYIRKLFELEVPEVAERIIEIRALAREAGYRTKVAVSSIDMKVDAVGACVGVRGSRIRNIVDELGGEKIDIVRWNESSQVLISNALKPAEVRETHLCFELGRATVIVDEDQLSLAIGKRGQNVRLGAQLTGWDIDILTPAEYDKNVDGVERALKNVEGIEDLLLDKMLAMGIVSLADFAGIGRDPLMNDLEMSPELADRVLDAAAEGAKQAAVEAEAARKAAIEAKKAAEAEAKAETEAGDDDSLAEAVAENEGDAEPGSESADAEQSEGAVPSDDAETKDASTDTEGVETESVEEVDVVQEDGAAT